MIRNEYMLVVNKAIRNCENLKILDLSRNPLTEESVIPLLQSLKAGPVYYRQVPNEIFSEELLKYDHFEPKLEKLYLAQAQLFDSGIIKVFEQVHDFK